LQAIESVSRRQLSFHVKHVNEELMTVHIGVALPRSLKRLVDSLSEDYRTDVQKRRKTEALQQAATVRAALVQDRSHAAAAFPAAAAAVAPAVPAASGVPSAAPLPALAPSATPSVSAAAAATALKLESGDPGSPMQIDENKEATATPPPSA
jgi:hypothetical protein